MRHQKGYRKLGRDESARRALLREQATSLFRHERITTTLAKAKETRRFAEKLITLAKKDTLHARRLAAREIHDKKVLKKLFDVLGPRYATRDGGYTRILKLGPRRGDAAEMGFLELVDRPDAEAPAKPEKKQAEAAAPAEPPTEDAREREAETSTGEDDVRTGEETASTGEDSDEADEAVEQPEADGGDEEEPSAES